MSILNAGITIKKARTSAKFTQQQLADGICKITTLSQIENGSLNASTAVFEALMSRLGISYTTYPCFCSRTDFDCFYTLKRAHFYLESWQLKEAVHELDFVETHHWADNKFHYAEWVLLYAKAQFLSGTCDHQTNYSFLVHGLSITNPNLDFSDFGSQLFSTSELEYLILIAEECLHLHREKECYSICINIQKYLNNAHIAFLDKDRLLAETAVALGKYYLTQKQYDMALSIIEPARYQMVINKIDLPLIRLTYLKGLSLYLDGQVQDGLSNMKVALYSAHAIQSCYATICVNYLKEYTNICTDELLPLESIPLVSFPIKETIYPNNLTNGAYDIFDKNALTIGQIIGQLREEQGISASMIYQGLCSKATYSRIERNETQPDLYLVEALLQRLGYSERPFVFYSNDKDNSFYTLKFKSINIRHSEHSQLIAYLEQMEELSSTKNILQHQYLIGRRATLCKSTEKQIDTYFKSLHCTLPDFDISRIHEYRLSWAEWSALNNIAFLYAKTNTPCESIYYFKQLISYASSCKLDILFHKNVYLTTLERYCDSLYRQNHYSDIRCFFDNSILGTFRCHTNLYSFLLFFYCQAMGECDNLDEAVQYGNYAFALGFLNQLENNSILLAKYLLDDFSITLDTF